MSGGWNSTAKERTQCTLFLRKRTEGKAKTANLKVKKGRTRVPKRANAVRPRRKNMNMKRNSNNLHRKPNQERLFPTSSKGSARKQGNPFALSRHLARLSRSAAGLGLPEPDLESIRAGAGALLEASGRPQRARLRITVTGGMSDLGSERTGSPLTAIVAVGKLTEWGPSCDVITVPWPRNELGATAGLKTTSYAENVRALA